MSGDIGGHAIFTLLLTLVAIGLFARDRIPFETSALALLVTLLVAFQFFPFETNGQALPPTSFFSGFGHEALISICALMILGHGLEKTGALHPVALTMARLWPRYPVLAFLSTLLFGAVLSAFVNNTPIVVLLLPMLVAVCMRNNVATTGVLLPMGLATSIGGMATTIGTSTNLLVVMLANDLGVREFGMFDFSVPVIIVGSVGIFFLWIFAPKLLPTREAPLTDTSPRVFTGTFLVAAGDKIADRTLAEVLERTGGRMQVDAIRRGEEQDVFVMKLPTVVLRPGNQLIVSDTAENLKAFELEIGAPLTQEVERTNGDADRSGEKLAEIAVTSGSALDNRTLDEAGILVRFKLRPVAFHRPGGSPKIVGIRKQRLRAGDILLVQGIQEQISALKQLGEMLVLDGSVDLPIRAKSRAALVIMGVVIAVAALGIAPISVTAVAGVLAMLLFGCLAWADAGDALSIPVILIIVASLALGSALIETGGAQFLADSFLSLMRNSSPTFVLASVMICMAAMTNVISNNAAAIIGTPIAIDIAISLGAPIEPFLLAVMFGANMSFATPIGYQTNLLVMSAGGYRFSDFLRVGVPLVLIMWLGFSVLLPIMYDM